MVRVELKRLRAVRVHVHLTVGHVGHWLRESRKLKKSHDTRKSKYSQHTQRSNQVSSDTHLLPQIRWSIVWDKMNQCQPSNVLKPVNISFLTTWNLIRKRSGIYNSWRILREVGRWCPAEVLLVWRIINGSTPLPVRDAVYWHVCDITLSPQCCSHPTTHTEHSTSNQMQPANLCKDSNPN